MKKKKKYLTPKIKKKAILNNLIATTGGSCGSCLPYECNILTVSGYVPIYKLQTNALVFSLNLKKRMQLAKIKKIVKMRVKKNHKLIKITLDSGESFSASFWHPLSNGLPIGFLTKGDRYNGKTVLKREECNYNFGYTYDILLDNQTNIYFTNGLIPLKSTLAKNQILPKIKEYITSSTSVFKSNNLFALSS